MVDGEWQLKDCHIKHRSEKQQPAYQAKKLWHQSEWRNDDAEHRSVVVAVAVFGRVEGVKRFEVDKMVVDVAENLEIVQLVARQSSLCYSGNDRKYHPQHRNGSVVMKKRLLEECSYGLERRQLVFPVGGGVMLCAHDWLQ